MMSVHIVLHLYLEFLEALPVLEWIRYMLYFLNNYLKTEMWSDLFYGRHSVNVLPSELAQSSLLGLEPVTC